MSEREDLVPGSVLADLDADRLAAERIASARQARADAAAAEADWARRQAGALEAVREWIEPRVGRPWGALRAELAAESVTADAELAVAEAELARVREQHRDAVGALRWLQRQQRGADPGRGSHDA